MKIRIHRNSLRLRLTQGDVAALREGKTVEDGLDFGDGRRFWCSLESRPVDAMHVHLAGSEVLVHVPEAVVQPWAASEQVGITGEQAAGEGTPMRIVIEKDFACLSPTDPSDNVDTFPNPNTTC